MRLVQVSNSQSLGCRPVWDIDCQMVTVVISGYCQPDEVNLRLIHIRQTELLFHANNYHLPNYQQTKDERVTDSCFTLIGVHQGDIMCTALHICECTFCPVVT